MIARSEERPKKRKRIVKGVEQTSLITLLSQEDFLLVPTTLNKEAQEHLARQEEEDLQASLALSREEARCSGLFIASPKASMDLVSLGSAPPLVLMMDIGVDTTSPTPVLELEASEAPGQEGVEVDTTVAQGSLSECDADLGEVGVPVHRGVLGSTFREASSCPSRKQLFRRPFNMEVRTLKILEGLGNVMPWALLLPSLDEEGRGADERMLLEYLPDIWKELLELEERVRLIDGEEVVAKAHGLAKGRLEVERGRCQVEGMIEGKRHFFFQLLEMGQRTNRAEALREVVEKAVLGLHSVLDATRAELDKAQDDVEGISLAW
ncbi:hypothetical protein ACLOJK_007961 [Asimina triloba]